LLFSLGIKASKRDVFYSSFSGLFFNIIFPSFIAGDIFRGFSISNRHGEAKKVASSVLMDRFSGFFGLMLVALISFFYGRNLFPQKSILYPLLILSALISFMFFLIFSKTFFSFFVSIFKKNSSFRNKIVSFHDQVYFFRKNPKVFVKSLLFSIPIQILNVISFFVASKAFNLHVGIIYFLILIPVITTIALIPITIGGLGLREGSVVVFFSLIGVDSNKAAALSFLNFIFSAVISLAGGILYVTLYRRRFQSRA
jgi:uncharacterized protein (TIRG00374 family)